MTYKQALDYLFNQLPIYQRKGPVAYKKDIGNIKKLCDYINNPHNQFKSIHIAGTNGKGSVAHIIASVLQESGYKTGLYTSPHLKDFRERIKINGKLIGKSSVVNFIRRNKLFFKNIDLSFFEMTVAMAFDYFAEEKVDVAIIETGLGGRLDSTNILCPEISIITNISYDHEYLLGNTIEKITNEKAGIIKSNTPVIIGETNDKSKQIFINKANNVNAPIYFSESEISNNYSTDLEGFYQKENLATSVTAIKTLIYLGWKIKKIKSGLKNVVSNTGLLGRWQILQKKPKIICDVAHNESGIKEIIRQLNSLKFNQLHIIFGTVNDKKIDTILNLLPKNALYYFCKANIPRSMDPKELKVKAQKFKLKGRVFLTVHEALSNAKKDAKKEDLIFVGGSTFVVAEVI
ncbi:MAG: folylpolyglutamate synthase/dihydrofolate synthase family protein [Bacteroidota bacterium]|nr:folylpolyglutamate synthase/dihydrofolate synthase family protein [Bacteroidota bacterium]